MLHSYAFESVCVGDMSFSYALCQIFFTGILLYVAIGLKWNFEEEIAFYSAYHQHPINQAIHFVFIPIIWWTFCLGMTHLPLLGLSRMNLLGHPISLGTAMTALYICYYIQLDPNKGGFIFAPFLLAGYLWAYRLVSRERKDKLTKQGASAKPITSGRWPWTVKLAITLNLIGWYAQIHPGHGIYEGVKPALVDSLAQAFGVAPLFAFYEGLWAVGFAPDLHRAVQARVVQERSRMCIEANHSYPFCSR